MSVQKKNLKKLSISNPIRLLFYDDSPVYGGHEIMIINSLEYLLKTDIYEISFIYSPINIRLESELIKIRYIYPKLMLIPFKYTSGRLQFLRTLWAIRPLQKLCKLVRSYHPDCLVAVQGEISLSALGVLAGVFEDIYTISYIPMAHSRLQRGDRFFPRLKDAILWWYYRFPKHFITISNDMALMLRLRCADQPIDVVENGIDLSALKSINKASARAQLGLNDVGFVSALCGRVEFKQKGHDVLMQALLDRGKEFDNWTFLIVGDGPDKCRLVELIKKLSLVPRVILIPWQADLSLVYAAVDMLLLPSRFEGVPVTMLEAMYCCLPIVSSDIPSITEFLPKDWLFTLGDSNAMANTMLRVRSADNGRFLKKNRQLISARFTKERQKLEFERVLNHCIHEISGKNIK